MRYYLFFVVVTDYLYCVLFRFVRIFVHLACKEWRAIIVRPWIGPLVAGPDRGMLPFAKLHALDIFLMKTELLRFFKLLLKLLTSSLNQIQSRKRARK